MFEDIKIVADRYTALKQELDKVEGFLKTSLINKLKNTSQEEIVDTIISLLNNQKSPEQLKHENAMFLDNLKQM